MIQKEKKAKITFIGSIIAIILFINALYMPVLDAYTELKAAKWREIDFLFLIKPYLMALIASFLMLFSALTTSRHLKKSLLYFVLVNVPMVLFFKLVLENDIGLDLYKIYLKQALSIYIFYLIFVLGVVLMLLMTIRSLFDYDVRLKPLKTKKIEKQ